MLFDWLVVRQVVDMNPAAAVRGPKHVVKRGKTPVLEADEARTLLESIDVSTLVGLRDRALIALLIYTFARVSAAIGMNVEDYYVQGRRSWVRLHEKGGKRHDMPAHHLLETYMDEYIAEARLAEDKPSPLFRTAFGKTGQLTERRMHRTDALRMIWRRARNAGIETELGCHSFRATGITVYLQNGGSSNMRSKGPPTKAPAPPKLAQPLSTSVAILISGSLSPLSTSIPQAWC